MRASLVLFQLVSTVGGIGAPIFRTIEWFGARVGFYVTTQLACFHKSFATLFTLEVLLPVVRPQVRFEQSELCRPVLASLECTSVDVSLVDTAMRSKVGVILGAGKNTLMTEKSFFWVDKIPETADCAFELPFISVDCLVLLQSVLVTKRLAADEASEARLAVNLLVFSQRHYRICPEITTLRPTSKLWPAIESHDINRMQKN